MAAACWCGIVVGRTIALAHAGAGEAWPAPAAAARAALAARAAWRAPRRVAAALLARAAFLAGLARGHLRTAALEAARAGVGEGALHRIAATVEGHPARASGRPLATLRIERADPPLARGARVRVRLPEDSAAEWGDPVRGLVELAPPRSRRNPGGWDPRESADAAGLTAAGSAFALQRPEPGPKGALLRATATRWRRAVERRLGERLGPGTRELVLPLVTGDRGALPGGLEADFRASGLVHLLALSGLHVSALAAVARALAASLGGGVGARAAAGAAAALFYLALAGPIPSLLRAVVTECWTAAARAARLSADPAQALAVTALALLGWNPGWALDLGFQLSCAASLGLALASATARPAPGGFARALAAALRAGIAAQGMCAPILMARVYGLAWPALAANLLAVPACGLLLASAWLALVADAVAPGAGHPFAAACEALARALVTITGTAARWPGALLATGHDPGVLAVGLAGTALLAAAACAPGDLESRQRGPGAAREALLGLGGLAAALAILLGIATPELRPPPGTLWIVALDVGQGDATAVGDSRGWWLVDAGPRSPAHDAGERVVRPFLRWAAVRRLRALVLTHDDGDHTGGVAAVRRAVRVEAVAGPGAGRPVGGATVGLARGDTLLERPLVVVRWPPPRPWTGADSAAAGRGDNASGLVLEIVAGRTRALLLADVDSVVEARLEPVGRGGLVKAGHHGSGSSSGAGFLARTRPAVAWISCGARNPYGHPSGGALARLAAAGARVDRTDREGALWYELRDGRIARLDWRARDPARGAALPAGRTAPGRAPAPRRCRPALRRAKRPV